MATGAHPHRRILLTGGSGLIGRALEQRLLDAGHTVYALRRRAVDAGPSGGGRLITLEGDLRSTEDVASAVETSRPACCFHLAWFAKPDEYLTSVPENLAAVRYSLDLLSHLVRAGCPQMVLAGTCAEYSLGPEVLREDGPTAPSTMYGAAKLALSVAAGAAARQAGFRLAWGRIFYVYGPGEDARRIVPRLISEIRTGKATTPVSSQRKDYLHVDDVAGALAWAADKGLDGPLNVCSGVGTTTEAIRAILAAAAAERKILAPEPLVQDGSDQRPIVGLPTVLRSSGWRPERHLEEGLASTLDWWLSSSPEGTPS